MIRPESSSQRLRVAMAKAALVAAILFAPLTASGGAASPTTDETKPPSVADVRAAIASIPADDALDLARLALEFAPEDPALHLAAIDAAAAAGERDLALHFAGVGASLETTTEADAKLFAKRLAELDPRPGAAQAMLDEYSRGLLELAKGFERRRLYANAVDLLMRCQGTASAEAASKLLERIYTNPRAVEALLESGVDVPVKPAAQKRSAAAIAREDARRSDWANAYEIKSENYTIRTNMGREMAEAMSTAMEQMGKFYRQVFRYKERGGTMRRCVIHVYAHRSEFDRHESAFNPTPTMRGFFVPGENRVATYDRRTDGGTLGDLWSTLFHEASHQFTSAATKNLVPGWLNEGTASYFEGARLTPNGRVETNLIPDNRLRGLYHSMGLHRARSEPTVRLLDVVGYFRPGSYSGEYYPWGWGLVYFIHNYENERSERIYLDHYASYWAAYAGAGQHDVVGRFVDHFIKRPAVPGVTDLASFERHFKDWIAALYQLQYGGPEQADRLIARGLKQAANGKHQYAIESFRWALRKRANDLQATYALGVAHQALGQTDAAIHRLRGALEGTRKYAPEHELSQVEKTGGTLEEDIRARLARLGATLADGAEVAWAELERKMLGLAEEYDEAGYPLAALGFLDRSSAILGRTKALASTAAEIRERSGVDTRQWRRVPIDPDLASWFAPGPWKADGWTIRTTSNPTPVFADSPYTTGPVWRFEVDLSFRPSDDGAATFAGIVIGIGPTGGRSMVALRPVGAVQFVELSEEGQPTFSDIGPFAYAAERAHRVVLEADGERLSVTIDGKAVGSRPMTGEELTGRLGYFQQLADAQFSNARVRE